MLGNLFFKNKALSNRSLLIEIFRYLRIIYLNIVKTKGGRNPWKSNFVVVEGGGLTKVVREEGGGVGAF